MKIAIFILALLGSACALQFPVEYQYDYEGRLGSGIPGIRSQMTAVGIKAKLIIQMKTKTQGIAKLEHIEVGEFNDDLQCTDIRQPIHLKWSPLPSSASVLEKPFAVSFEEEQGHVMSVPSADVEYITNIRKSIVEALRLEPLISNMGGIQSDRLSSRLSGGEGPEAFSVEEETIFGRCECDYSLAKVPEYLREQQRQEIEQHLKEDSQRQGAPRSRTSSMPTLAEDYWRMVRAVNFDKCHDRVILQHAGVGNMSEAGYGQFKAVQSRSSVSSYILKGAPGAFRLERAIIEGEVLAHPFGFKTHQIQTITNQTLVLTSAQDIKTPIPLPSPVKDVRTWRYELASPFPAPEGHPKLWINYQNKKDKLLPVDYQTTLLGQPPSSSQIQEYKTNFLHLLDQVIRQIYSEPSEPMPENPSWKSTQESQATTYMYYMTRMMRVLPESQIEQIFSEVFGQRDVTGQRKQMMLSDIAATSGAAAPIHVVLQKMKSGQISHNRTAAIFALISNNVLAPSIIPEIVDFAKSMDVQKNPAMASSVLINTASLVEKVCLDQKRHNYSVPSPLFGSFMCKPQEIVNSFLPHLQQKAQSASKSWERSVYVKAISNLGSADAFQALKPYIYGQVDSTPRIRNIAIYGLTHRHMPESLRQQVFDILMEILDNLREVPEVRQAAFNVLCSWHPNSAWWQRLARLTWREPNKNVASLISSTITALAKSTDPALHKQSRIAAFVYPLMKPSSGSYAYSFNHLYSQFDQVLKGGLNTRLEYMYGEHGSIPAETTAAIQGNFGDLHLEIIEGSLASAGFGDNLSKLMNSLRNPSSQSGSSQYSVRGSSSRSAENIAQKMRDYVGSRKLQSEEQEADIYVRAFENMHQYLPLNSEVISILAGQGGSRLIQKLLQGTTMNFTKFANPIDLEYFLPTEIGLPVMGVVALPSMNKGDVAVQMFAQDLQSPTIEGLLKAENVSLIFKTNYKFMSKLIVKMQVPTPWNRKVAEAGVETFKQVNLPVYGNLTIQNSEQIKNGTLNLAPYIAHQFPVVYTHNVPYSAIRAMTPSPNMIIDYKVIGVEKDRSPALKNQKSMSNLFSGLGMKLVYNADTQYPFESGFFAEYAMNSAQTVKALASPTAKQYQGYMSLQPQDSTHNVSISFSFLKPFQRNAASVAMPDFAPQDTASQKLQKLASLSEGNQVYGLDAQLLFNGSEFRKYEALFAFTRKSHSQQQKKYKTVAALMATPIPGYTQAPQALCAHAEFVTPAVHDIQSLVSAVRSIPQESVQGQVHYGNHCQASKLVSFQGYVKMSSERARTTAQQITDICDASGSDPSVVLQTPAVYDLGHLEVTFSQEKFPAPLLNMTYSAQQTIEGAAYPQGYYDNMRKGEHNKISVDVMRHLSSKGYTFWASLPQKYSIISDIFIPNLITRVVPWSGFKVSYNKYSKMVVSGKSEGTCSIDSRQLSTYDGVSFAYEPLKCWTTAAVDIRKPDAFILHTRRDSSGQFEAQAVIPEDQTTVVISHTKATVNGAQIPPGQIPYTVKNKSGQSVMLITNDRSTASYSVKVYGFVSAQVYQDRIVVHPEQSMRGILRGVCGDFDGSTAYDKTGPQNCIYSDEQLFKYAWTIPEGDQCNTQEYQAEKQKVEQFQQNCPHRPSSRVSSSELRKLYGSKATSQCYESIYPIQKKGPAVCVTIQPVQKCTDQCRSAQKTQKTELGKCWIGRNVPQVVRDGESRGYVTQPVPNPAKFRDELTVAAAVSCQPK